MWKVRHREVKFVIPDHTAGKRQSWNLNMGGPGKTVGACLQGIFRGEFYKTEVLWGSGWLLANCRIWVLVFLSYNKAAFRALYTGGQRPKAVLNRENSPGSNWELEQEKCVISDVKVSNTRLPTNTLSCPPSGPGWNNSLLSTQTKGFLHLCKGGKRAGVTPPTHTHNPRAELEESWLVASKGSHLSLFLLWPCAFSLLAPAQIGLKNNVPLVCQGPSSETSSLSPGTVNLMYLHSLSNTLFTLSASPGIRSNIHDPLPNLKTRLQSHI